MLSGAQNTDRSVEDVATLSGDPVVNEARRHLDQINEWEGEFRKRFIEDLKFRHGDADNGYQWPNAIRHSRDTDQRPCLTMNVVRQHNLQIANAARQAKSSIKIIAQGGGASAESAQAFKWLTQRIEYKSNAQAIYTLARSFQVDGGRGWWRLITDWAGPDTFDQEIYIRPVTDPLSVFIDPDGKMADQPDQGARWALVFDMVPRSEFKEAYPDLKDLIGDQALGSSGTGGDWIPKDHIILCEYFRKVPREDLLVNWLWNGQRHTLRKEFIPDEIYSRLIELPGTRTRETYVDEVEWYLIAGDQVLDHTLWPGKYIPLIKIIGEESIIDGMYDCKGHTRAMKDAQRLYNFNASAQAEFVALQSKTPWVAPIEAIEKFQGIWETANLINHAYLPYNYVNEQNPEKPIPAPTRIEPPTSAPAFQAGMEVAFNQMMMVSGQWQNQMGMMGNERTGEAISRRQEQGDTATFHFQDNYAEGLRNTGKQIIDLIPKVYDTQRVFRVMTEEGMELDLEINPGLRKAYEQELNHKNEIVRRVFNPSVGDYDVASDVGPAAGTRRQENVDALTLILTQAPALTGIIGDLLLRNLDFEDGQEAARRLRRMVPPQALGEGPTPAEQQQTEQIASLQVALSKALQRAGSDRVKLQGKDQMRDIDVYEAETKRITALAGMLPEDADGLTQMIQQLVQDTLATHLLPIMEANAKELGTQGDGENLSSTANAGGADSPPIAGAKKAQDGEWYLADPTRVGKYLRVRPLAQERNAKGIVSNA